MLPWAIAAIAIVWAIGAHVLALGWRDLTKRQRAELIIATNAVRSTGEGWARSMKAAVDNANAAESLLLAMNADLRQRLATIRAAITRRPPRRKWLRIAHRVAGIADYKEIMPHV